MTITTANYSREIDPKKLPETLQKSHDFAKRATKDFSNWNTGNDSIDKVLKLHIEKVNEWTLSTGKKENPKKSRPFNQAKTVKKAVKKAMKERSKAAVKSLKKSTPKRDIVKDITEAAKKAFGPKTKVKELLKFKKGQRVWKANGESGKILKPYTNHQDFRTSYLVETENGNKYWYEDELLRSKPKSLPKGTPIESIPIEVAVIKTFAGYHGKQKNRQALEFLLAKIQKAILEKKIRKTTPHSDLVMDIQRILVKAINQFEGTAMTIQIKDVEKYRKVGESVRRMPVIGLLKQYVTLHNKTNVLERAQQLLAKLKKAVEDETNKSHKKQALEAIRSIEAFVAKKQTRLVIDEYELEGLAGIGCKCSQVSKRKRSKGVKGLGNPEQVAINPVQKFGKLFSSLDKIEMKGDTFKLPGQMGEFFGDLEQHELAMTIIGDQGAGKTPFVLQLADAFADMGKDVAIFSLEISPESKVMKDYVGRNVKQKNHPKILIAGQAPNGIDTIRQVAKDFDVLVIDSWNKLDVNSSEFDRLRKDYPGTILVSIFQSTSGGEIRGGTKPLFDAPVNVYVNKEGFDFTKNFAQLEKSRYGNVGGKYSMFQKSIVKD